MRCSWHGRDVDVRAQSSHGTADLEPRREQGRVGALPEPRGRLLAGDMAAEGGQRATAPDASADDEPARHDVWEVGSSPSLRDAEEDAQEDMQASLVRVSESSVHVCTGPAELTATTGRMKCVDSTPKA